MPPAPIPLCEPGRLEALRVLEILDTPPDRRFEVFTRLACDLLDAPIAAVSLVDADRVWFKSMRGLEAAEVPRDVAFCSHTILAPGRPLIVPDTTRDQRFVDSPLVTGPPCLRFYAGVPLASPAGHAIGALCVIDPNPRPAPSAAATARLAELARGVEGTLELHQALRALAALAARDPLTGLANRRAFDARLRRRAPDGPPAALLCLDLDGFKPINDLFGHAGGDAALAEVARRLVAATRPSDLVARLGGDEFAVLCEEGGGAAAAGVAARIHRALAEPFLLHGQPVPLRTSIGVARAPADAQEPEDLLRLADAALYRAKRDGRGTTRVHQGKPEPDGADRSGGAKRPCAAAARPGREAIEAELRADLLAGEAARGARSPVRVVWQPMCDPRTRRPVALEALCRWRRPGSAALLPEDFIPVAEATGMVAHLDLRVLSIACREAAGWPLPLPIAVNLSAASLFRLDLVEAVGGALSASGLAPERLTLEVTETALVQDVGRARAALAALRRLGTRVALDDFGAGHNSLGYLRDFVFDVLKIDRAFVADLRSGGARAEAVVSTIVSLGRRLGLCVAAEGVETEAELAFLRAEGADAVQGFLLGRPGPADALVAVAGATPRAA